MPDFLKTNYTETEFLQKPGFKNFLSTENKKTVAPIALNDSLCQMFLHFFPWAIRVIIKKVEFFQIIALLFPLHFTALPESRAFPRQTQYGSRSYNQFDPAMKMPAPDSKQQFCSTDESG